MLLPGGIWVLGPGDTSPEIRKIKGFLRGKFRSYAGQLADTELYDEQLFNVVKEVQRRYGMEPTGFIGYSLKVRMGYLAAPDTRPLLLTVGGAMSNWWTGPDADTARGVVGRYCWQGLGFDTRPFPMKTGINDAKRALHVEFNRAEPNFMHRQRIERYGCAMIIYSMGSVAAAEVYRDDILPVSGSLHWVLPHLKKVITYGFPQRQFGKVWPDNGGSPMASLTSGGVDSKRMTSTPDWWRNYAHQGDLYAATEPGAAAEDKNAIWEIVRDVNFFSGPDSLLSQVLELSQMPFQRTIAAFTALWDAGMFFAKGTSPHTNYNVGPAVEYLMAG